MSSSPLALESTIRLSSRNGIPRLAFGVAFGIVKVQSSEELSIPSTLEAFRVGYRHIDTAQVYGNEVDVGEAVRQSGLKREDLFVTSKVSSSGNPTTAVDVSLKRLGFDYIDLYLIHSPPEGSQRRLTLWEELLAAKKAGKIRSAGVSNFNVRHLEEIKNAGLELPSVNQIELHPLCQQRPIVEYCRANNIAVEAYCPIIRGRLGHPTLVAISEKHERNPAQILLRWSIQHDFIPIVNSSDPKRILSNSQIYDFELDEEDMSNLDALDQGAEGAIGWNPVNVA